MPIDLAIDPLSIELHEREIELPVHARLRDKGTVRVTLRELPYAVKHSTEMQGLSNVGELSKASEYLGRMAKGDLPAPSEFSEMGQAFARLREGQLELIRWGVVGHRAEDFKLKGVPIPFETVEKKLTGVLYNVVSPRMLVMYQMASPGLSPDTLFWRLAEAVREFQHGTIRTPEEVWAEAEKRDAKDVPAKATKKTTKTTKKPIAEIAEIADKGATPVVGSDAWVTVSQHPDVVVALSTSTKPLLDPTKKKR